MIDLQRTKTQMLEEIQASQQMLVDISIDDCEQYRALPTAARLLMRGNTLADFHLPRLNRALSTHFAYLSPDQLNAELLTPLKRGLGNAYKWGNRRDPNKALRVEVVVTTEGVVIEIQDEGAGFDVARVVQRLQQGGHYYTNQGKGFAHFNKMRSTISYVDGGRTFLLCFRCFPQVDGQYSFLGDAGDPRAMRTRLANAIPHFHNAQTALKTCHIYVPETKEDHPPELKYVVAYRHQGVEDDGTPATNRYLRLTGRLLPPDKAAIDYHTAVRLVQRGYNQISTSQIPTPIAHLTDLGLVLYEFMPRMNLRKFASRCQDEEMLAGAARQIGAGLRTFHQLAQKPPRQEETNALVEAHAQTIAELVETVATANPRQAQTITQIYTAIQPKLRAIAPLVETSIHGEFNWINIWYDRNRFYFYHFESSTEAHPGYDLGRFLADLQRFCMIQEPDKLIWHQSSHHAFLDAYLGDTVPDWYSAIPFFTVEAMLLSLPRLLKNSPKKWYKQLDAYLDLCYSVGLYREC